MQRTDLGRLCVICGVTSAALMLLVFVDLYYTGSHWSAIEKYHDSRSVLVGLVLVIWPFVGTALACLFAGLGAVLGCLALLQKGSGKFASLAGLALIGFTLCVAIAFLLGMGSFRNG